MSVDFDEPVKELWRLLGAATRLTGRTAQVICDDAGKVCGREGCEAC